MRKLLLFIILLIPMPVLATNHYFLASATGSNNGTSWTNAWTTLTDHTWVRGDTYYLGAGTYTGNLIVTNSDNGTWLYIKKATIADHGIETGWDNAFAAQAINTGTWTFYGGHLSIDGAAGSDNSGHGIKIDCSALTTGACLTIGTNQSYLSLKHVEIAGGGANLCNNQAAIGANAITAASNLTFSYNYIHDFGTNGITLNRHSTVLIEHNYFASIQNPAGCAYHGQIVQLTGTAEASEFDVRYNKCFNCGGQGFFSMLGGAASSYLNMRVYDNVLWSDDKTTWYFVGAVSGLSGASYTGILVYNNTFYNIKNPETYFYAGSTTSGCENRNNIYVSSFFQYAHRGVNTSSNNFYYDSSGGNPPPYKETGEQDAASSPFVNAPSDLTLHAAPNAALDTGYTLGSPYDSDILGVLRPQSSAFDIGAYEYYPTNSPTVLITTPTSSSTYSTDQATLNLAGTASAVAPATVSSVACVNDRGGTCTVVGTDTWTVTAAALSAGVNVLTFTVTDSAAETSTDAISVSRYVISSVAAAAGSPAQTNETITWTTNISSDSRVDYGLTDAYGSYTTSSSSVTSHSMGLTGLAANTLYHYKVTSATFSSADGTFTTAAEEVTAPVISAVASSSLGFKTATITWTTDLSSTSVVYYGLTAAYGSTSSSATPTTSHSISLSGLLPGVLYHYTVTSTAAGNVGTTTDYTFITPGTGGRF
jgi:hypothetical protein